MGKSQRLPKDKQKQLPPFLLPVNGLARDRSSSNVWSMTIKVASEVSKGLEESPSVFWRQHSRQKATARVELFDWKKVAICSGPREDLTTVDALSSGVDSFLQQNEAGELLMLAHRLIRENFTSVEEISSTIEDDPDTGEQWVVMDVVAGGDVSELLESYTKYNQSWIEQVPAVRRELVRIEISPTDAP